MVKWELPLMIAKRTSLCLNQCAPLLCILMSKPAITDSFRYYVPIDDNLGLAMRSLMDL